MLRSRFMDIQGYVQISGTFKVTFKILVRSRLRSRVRSRSGIGAARGVIGSIQRVKLARDTGCGRIDSGSVIGTRHGAL